MAFFEEVHGQVGRIGNDLVTELLSVIIRYVGEEIEGTMGYIDLETGYLTGQLDHQVATALKCLAHLFYTTLVARKRCHRSLLGYGAGARRVLALQFVACLGQPQGGGNETDTPTGHGISLGHTVDNGYPITHILELGDTLVTADIIDMLIDFIGQNDDLGIFGQNVGQRLQFLARIYATGRIRRRAENNGLCFGRNGGFELGRRYLEIGVDARRHHDALALGQFHHLDIAHPAGCRNDDLIAGVDDTEYGVAYRLFGTVGNDNLLGSEIEVIFIFELRTDGFAQIHITGHRRIEREVVVDGLFGCGFDVVGGKEIGLTHAQVDNIDALRF